MAKLFAVAIVLAAVIISSTVAEAAGVPAMFVFGDSTADVGNNNHLPGSFQTKANFPHNGVDYPGGVPTGRFSNGYNGIDYMARKLGFKQSPPPVLSVNSTDVLKGVSFASGASGILDITGQNVSLSMNKQINYFKLVGRVLLQLMGKKKKAAFLSKSVFVFSTASNDIFGFFAKSGPQNDTQKDQFVSLLQTNFKAQLKKLYSLGVRKFVVVGTGHLGCIPFVRTSAPGGNCVGDLNDLSRRNNRATRRTLRRLAAELEGMQRAFVDPYGVLAAVLADPLRFGFREVRSACCGGGRLRAETPCVPNATYCPRRDEYLFWDAFHPTQKTYQLVAALAPVDGSRLLG